MILDIKRKDINSKKLGKVIIHLILSIGLIFTVTPFVFMVMNSFKPGLEIVFDPGSLPSRIDFAGYKMVFEELRILRLFKNTMYVIAVLGSAQIIGNSLAGYAMAKIVFYGREIVFKIMLWSIMIPGTIMLIPTYMMMYRFGWVDTYKPLIIPMIMGAYNIYLFRQFISQIPDDYIEAAKLDGANHIYIYSRIILPMSIPIISTIALLQFMAIWNDLITPLLYLRKEELETIQIGLWRFSTQIEAKQLAARWAGIALSTIPLVILYLYAQKYFMKAFANYGLK